MSSVTINDVARLAGVSIKSVSRVLNGEPHVRPQLREKVLNAVQTLNYRPNVAARALAGSRSYVLGLYFDVPSSEYITNVMYGASSGCRQMGYHLLVEQIESSAPDAPRQVEALLATVKVDGLILSPPVCDSAPVLDFIERSGVPHVRIAPGGDFERGPYVYMDDRTAAYQMTAHLQELGHQRIGFIQGDPEHSAARLRYEGFLQAMQDAGLEVQPQWVEPGRFNFLSGLSAARRLLSLSPRPTAIFASNDDQALGVMAAANRIQLHVPRQLSVAGFDDSSAAQVAWPQLTTIRQPARRMAFEAAILLIQGLNGAQTHKARLLDFELVVRGSTGAPEA